MKKAIKILEKHFNPFEIAMLKTGGLLEKTLRAISEALKEKK